MPKINLLDSSVYNRIAAGEVVQQPASVVKELLENSIDSGASEITIEISDGGIKEIRVQDNGCGISKFDIKNAFLPHATSKVKEISDLDSISTLGFRGEALASIASVAIVEVLSKTEDSDEGTKFSVQGGEFGEIEVCSCNKGTIISVNNIFYNTPARAKFLKKPYQEEADITSVVQKTIFANPDIAFTYVVDNKIVYKTNGNGLLSALIAVYGSEIQNHLLELNFTKYNVTVRGYVCTPTYTKANRNYQTIIINGRYVKDIGISSVVANAFGERLMKRNFPVFVLDVLVPFDDVDVNVHPAKTEIRFRKQSEVYGAIYNAVKQILENNDKQQDIFCHTILQNQEVKPLEEQLEFSQTDKNENTEKVSQLTTSLLKSILENNAESEQVVSESTLGNTFFYNALQNAQHDETQIKATQKPTVETKVFEQIKYDYIYLGQLFDCYLLLQSNDNFIMIDQHAAHERLLYDQLIEQSESQSIAVQPLLLPYTASFSPKDFARIMDIKDSLCEIGIELEEFGKYTIKISAVPLPLIGIKLGEFLDGFLKDFDNRTDFSYTDLLKEKLAARACKSAVKAGDRLQKDQIDSILKQIIDSNMTLQCPHGRPVALKYSKTEIEKLFKRIIS